MSRPEACPFCGIDIKDSYPSGRMIFQCGTDWRIGDCAWQADFCRYRIVKAEVEQLKVENKTLKQALAEDNSPVSV